MTKILLKINNNEELMYPVSGYILGIDKYSYLFEKTYSIEEIKTIKDNNFNKEVFVSFNRIIFNDELDNYKKTLKEVDQLGLSGIIIGDVAALTYDIKTPLILDQMHLNNSHYSINHYYNNGLSGVVLTNDITKDEIDEIRKNTNALLFKQVFGYPHLSTSNRMLITNYLNYFNINTDKNSNNFTIKEKKSNDAYKIIEDDFGAHIFGNKVLNLLGIELNVDYKVIDSYMLDNIKEVVFDFKTNNIANKDKINDLYNADDGFINKETIFRVKKDEK